ncbi:tail fiber assembly protein [Providencia sp. Je.9.19]|uniref:tail fiber assembly protein n=1 Tax=Providencia sp. Je.9.19 TaxID=3142844 RepID=UPI003DA9ACCF
MYYYSAKNNAFYPEELKTDYISAGSFPDDVIEIKNATYVEFSSTPPKGKIRGNQGGELCWVNEPEITKEELIEYAEKQKKYRENEAIEAIVPLQYAIDLGIVTDKEMASLNDWKEYRVYLNRVDTSTAPEIEWPAKPS